MTHAFAVIVTLGGFLVLATSYYGWGMLAARMLGTRPYRGIDEALTILCGWAFSLLVLQILNFVLPISTVVSITVFLVGFAVAVPAVLDFVKDLSFRRFDPRMAWITAAFVMVAVWIASRGMFPLENFDSGLYHLPTIRWIRSYPIVPGLGNLHGRLAFNQSFFTYAAAMDAAWFFRRAPGSSNGFLFLVVLLQAIQGLLHRRSTIHTRDSAPHPLTWVADLMLLPVLAYVALSSDGLTAPTPDLAAALLQLSMFLIFTPMLGAWISGKETTPFGAIILPLLAATAITVKLSTIAFSGSILIACVLHQLSPRKGSERAVKRTLLRLLPAILVGMVWLARGVILSGCPIYPAQIGCTAVSWAVPSAKIINEANWVYSWAREPGVHWQYVLGNSNWMGQWFARELRDVVGFAFPLGAALILSIGAIALRLKSRTQGTSAAGFRDFAVFIPIAIGIVFWFFAAPDPRFGRAFFWMMSIAGGIVFLASLSRSMNRQTLRMSRIALFVAINAPFIVYFVLKGGPRLARVSASGWSAMRESQLTLEKTRSGLQVYVPANGEKCWDGPLPCTPYFNPWLSLRDSSRLSSGFTDKTPLVAGAPSLTR